MRSDSCGTLRTRTLVISYRRFGTNYRNHLQGTIRLSSKTTLPLNMGPRDCTKTSVRNYQSTARKIPKKRNSKQIFLVFNTCRYFLGPPKVLLRWYRGLFLCPGSKADRAPPFSAEAKNPWSYISNLVHIFMALSLSKHTDLPTPRRRVLLDKLTSFQLVKKFPAFYGTRRFITAFTLACHLSLS